MPATPLPSADGALRDRHGRTAHDLRVSLTDRCNLRCSYCMPPEGLAWLPTDQMLTDAEVTRLCTLAVTHLGIHKIRFTGGEPLLRKGLESIVAACAGLRTDRGSSPELALTTNALGLAHRARALADAGLDRVNVSLDTLDREHFARITHRDRLPDVLAGIRAAQDAGLTPVKVNAVVTRAINAPDLPELFDFCLDNSLQLRVIEQMPIGPEGSWDRASMVSRAEILELLATRHQLAELSSPPTTGTLPDGALPDGMPPSTVQPEHSAPSTSAPHTAEPTVAEPTTAPLDPHAPAQLWQVDGRADTTVGIIASVSAPFCQACDRTRLTSDGQVRSCLFSTTETDLRALLRSGATDAQLADAWRAAMWAKPRAHGLDEPWFAVPSRTMSRIGG